MDKPPELLEDVPMEAAGPGSLLSVGNLCLEQRSAIQLLSGRWGGGINKIYLLRGGDAIKQRIVFDQGYCPTAGSNSLYWILSQGRAWSALKSLD